MQNPLIIGLIVFAVILIGAFVGGVMRQCLPKHQLSEETKSTVTVSMAVVATFSALGLGLWHKADVEVAARDVCFRG
jgi:uncharacterized membrane protein YraQ (UPF0718 family)